MPQISVIVPVYKVEPYLKRCVDSILGQTFTDFELILIDDGSPDNCGAICDEYAEKDQRVKVIHQANGGLSAARNAGIDYAFEKSDSDWLTFIDSDDWVHPQYLELLLKAADENNVAISVCNFERTNGETPEVDTSNLSFKLWNPEDFYVDYNVNATIACAKLYKKECFNEIRYPVGKIHEDEFVTYKILFATEKIAFANEPLYAYYVNNEGITGSPWNIKRLVVLEAFNAQLCYFKSKHYKNAFNKAIKNYFLFASSQIENVINTGCSNKKEIVNWINSNMKKWYFINHGLPDYSQQQREWVMAKIFPFSMRLYLKIKQIFKIV